MSRDFLEAQLRENKGKAAMPLFAERRIPAVVYGGKEADAARPERNTDTTFSQLPSALILR